MNPVTSAPGSGWVLALLEGRTLIGKPHGHSIDPAPAVLSPVYELNVQAVRTEDGQVGMIHVARPILFLPSLDSIDVPDGTPIIPLVALSVADQRALMASVDRAKEGTEAMRQAQDSRVQIAPAGMRLPTLEELVQAGRRR